MKKRLLNLFLALVLVACVLPMAASAAGRCEHEDIGTTTVAKAEAEAATCTEAGYEAYYYCTVCEKVMKLEGTGYVETTKTVIPASHTWQRKAAFAATCTTDGWNGGDVCKVCDAPRNESNVIPALGHDYQLAANVKLPTCTEKGTDRYRCTRCDAAEIRYPAALGHQPYNKPAIEPTCSEVGRTAGKQCGREGCKMILEGMEEVEKIPHTPGRMIAYIKRPTCQETGSASYECTKCVGSVIQEIRKLACNIVELEAVAPTCTETGLTAGTKCDSCNNGENCAYCAEHLVAQEEVPVLGHNYEFVKYKPGMEPTCINSGTAIYQCTLCDDVDGRPAEALSHTEVEIPATAATCTEPAMTAGVKCSVCEEVLTEPVADGKKLGHDFSVYVETVTEATCTAKAVNKYKCQGCAYTKDLEAGEPLGHNYVFVKYKPGMEATCTTGGTEIYECTRCKDVDGRDVEALGHDMKVLDVYRESSCTQVGCIKSECAREGCDLVTIEETAALGHTEVILPVVPATCTATGLGEGKKCSVCSEVLTEQEVIPMLAHTWKIVTAVEPTCTTDGHNAYQECEVCHTTQNKEVIDGGHNFVNYICTECGVRDGSCEHEGAEINVVNSTCTTAGSESFRCGLCGYEYVETLPLAAHQEVDQSVAATCTQKGKTHKVCGVCGQDTMGPVEIPTIAHNNVNGSCSVCGLSLCSHSQKSTQTHASTCTERGYVIETCNSCGKVTTRELPLAAHKHVNGICSACGHIDENRITSDFQDIFVVG